LYTALQSGFPAGRIKLHGNFKKPELLRMAIGNEVGRIVADSTEELHTLSEVAEDLGRDADILIRLAPGIKADTNQKIRTGQDDSKFGIGMASSQAMDAARLALELPGLHLHGFHCHIGSQLLHTDDFVHTVDVVVGFLARVREETGFITEQFDIGGGLGIRYVSDDVPPTIDSLAVAICSELKRVCEKYDLPVPELVLEPGRSIVGEAGMTLYTLGVVKHIPLVRTYASVDGGLSDNPRPVMYDAEYEALIANRADKQPQTAVRLSGAHCETDTLIDEVLLADPQPGDIVAVSATGAYNYAMASNYNRFRRPAMILVNDGNADIIVRREELSDLLRQDVVPERLK
ncbi:MAG: diaminopimelate decarboxylase, partial [Armatimonadota bacterium]